MRVLMVAPSYYPIIGGAESVIKNFSSKLNQIGIQTDIMTFNLDHKWKPYWHANIEKIDGINVFRIPAINWLPIEHSDRITMGINLIPGPFRNRLKEYDIIHFHSGDLTLPSFSFAIKKPKIFHSHGFSLHFNNRLFFSKIILKNIANLYVTISKQMQTEFVELGIPLERIRYIPNSINTNFFHPIEKKDKNLILFVGRIVYNKGLHILLESLKYIKTKTDLVIIGPPGNDVKYFQEIQMQIDYENKRGVHTITYLGGQKLASIVKWYQKASILAQPSFSEAFCVTIIEAMSCETPIVATNVGGIPELINNGENGVLIPPHNVLKLAQSIQYLLDNDNLLRKFGNEGRKIVVENYSLDTNVTRLVKIYKELL